MSLLTWFLLIAAGALALLYFRFTLILSTGIAAAAIAVAQFAGDGFNLLPWLLFLLVAVPLNAQPLRRAWLSKRLFGWFRKVLPPMSDTEREAIDAGSAHATLK